MMKADSAYRTITEVADLLQVQASVLRFWETQFSQIKPIKRMGGRRYYRAEDVVLLAQIRDYLYKEGLTTKGVQRRLKQESAQAIGPVGLGKDMQSEDAFVQEVIDIKSYLSDYL